jgi:hypothetical protein
LDDPRVSSIAVLSSGLTTIAVPVKQTADGVRVLPFGADVPRLFSDFPLLGTQSFTFPVVHQQSDLQSHRTPGRQCSLPKPTVLFLRATTINGSSRKRLGFTWRYFDYASENDWQHLHRLAAVKPVPSELARLDPHWFKTAILQPMRNTLLRTKIVRTTAGALASIHSPDDKNNIWFPSGATGKNPGAIWRCAKHGFPNSYQHYRMLKSGMTSSGRSAYKLTFDQVAVFIEDDDTHREAGIRTAGKR